MNQGSPTQPLNDADRLENLLNQDAENFHYPPISDFATRTPWQAERKVRFPRPRRLLWVTILIIALLSGLLAVPQVRGAIFEILHIGNISVIPATMTPQPTPTGTLSRVPSPTPLLSVLDLAGASTLKEAEVALKSPIRLPSYPATLGQPDKVFMQGFGAPVAILVWLDKAHPDQARLSLYVLGPDAYADKFSPQVIQQTTVNGQPAVWVQGQHVLQLTGAQGSDYVFTQLVSGNVLIWSEGGLSYRLESGFPLADAIKVAESLR